MVKSKKSKKEFSTSILRVKEFLEKEKVYQEKCLNNTLRSFSVSDVHSLFESKKTISDIELTGQFAYHKLNLEYVKKLGINLIPITSNTYFSDDCNCIKFIYVEYYLCVQTSAIIFVEYHFKHIKLLSRKTVSNLNTFVFVNSTSDIYCYNGFFGKNLLNHFETNMSVNDSIEIFAQKKFSVVPSEDRIYRINSLEYPELFEQQKLKDISLIPKRLLGILLKKYENDNIPPKSEIKLETHFIGFTKNPNTVISTVPINYKYSGIIETYEKLHIYEIVLYFSNIPETKVKARLFLTEAEKNKTLILTKKYLEDAILEDSLEDVLEDSVYKNLYNRYIINKNSSDTKNKNYALENDIKKAICNNATIESSLYDFPLLKDTFKKIYINFLNIHIENFPKEYSLNHIRESKLEYDGEDLTQTSMYSIVYQNSIYLLKVTCYYKAYTYKDHKILIYLPIFSISDIEVSIFKPFSTAQIDDFIYDNLDSSNYLLSFYISSILHNHVNTFDTLKEMFPDFDIILNGNKNCFHFTEINNSTIYNKILNCIQTPKVSTSTFHFSGHRPFMYDDEEDTITRVPIYSNGLIYAYYLDDGNTSKTINCSFADTDGQYTYSTADDLLRLNYEGDIPFYKITFYKLLKEKYPFSYNIEANSFSLENSELWKECINFLLNIVI